MSDVTRILSQIDEGDPQAAQKLLPLIYDELRRLAAVRLAQERPGQTLEATALVHEAYVRLVGVESNRPWEGRRHFFAAAAEAMRRILIDNARRKAGPKQGGGFHRVDLDCEIASPPLPAVDLLALDEALERLATEAPARAQLVKLRYFVGLTLPEAAEVLNISLATAERHWTYARTWLFAELQDNSRISAELGSS